MPLPFPFPLGGGLGSKVGPCIDDPAVICGILVEGGLNEAGRAGNSTVEFIGPRTDAYEPPRVAPVLGMAICISTDCPESLSTPSVISLSTRGEASEYRGGNPLDATGSGSGRVDDAHPRAASAAQSGNAIAGKPASATEVQEAHTSRNIGWGHLVGALDFINFRASILEAHRALSSGNRGGCHRLVVTYFVPALRTVSRDRIESLYSSSISTRLLVFPMGRYLIVCSFCTRFFAVSETRAGPLLYSASIQWRSTRNLNPSIELMKGLMILIHLKWQIGSSLWTVNVLPNTWTPSLKSCWKNVPGIGTLRCTPWGPVWLFAGMANQENP